jgi:hypothetical protein
MSAYPPPVEELPIFNPAVFIVKDTPLTIAEGEKYFLKYPQAQGTQNFTDINVGGIATIEDVRADTLEVAGNADLNGNLDVSGAITGQTITDIDTRLDIIEAELGTGVVHIADTETITGDKTLSGTTTFTGNIIANGATITPTELGYIDGATSNIQTQINDINTGTPGDNIVHINGAETITGVKTFNALPLTALTPSLDNHLTRKKYVDDEIDSAILDLIDGAPTTLNTLNELAEALGDDPNYATTIATALGLKAIDTAVVHKTGNETIGGIKTFTSGIVAGGGISGGELEIIGDDLVLLGADQTFIEASVGDVRIQATAGDGLTKSVKIGMEDAEIASFKSGDIQLKQNTTITGNLVSSGTNASITATSNAGMTGEVLTLTSGTTNNGTRLQMTDNLVKIGLSEFPDNLEVIGEVICATAPTGNDRLANKLYVDTKVSKSGDTMTGGLTIQDGNLTIEHSSNSGNFYPYILLNSNQNNVPYDGVSSLFLTEQFVNRDRIQGAYMEYNGGSNFFVIGTQNNYDAGTSANSRVEALRINRASGNIISATAPTDDTHLTNKLYVDNEVDTKVSKSGDTMTGTLNVPNIQVDTINALTNNIGISTTNGGNINLSANGTSADISLIATNDVSIYADDFVLSGTDVVSISAGNSIQLDGNTTMTGDLTVNGSVKGDYAMMSSAYTDLATFSHKDVSDLNTKYAVMQASNGYTYLNSTSTLDFRINHVGVGTWNTTRLRCNNNLEVGGDITLSGNNIKSDDNQLNLYSNGNSIDSTGYIELRADWSKLAGKLIYFVTDTDGSNYGTTRMTIAQDGNITMTGNLTITNPNEINYKNQTLDARFVPKQTGDNRQVNWSEVGVRNFDVHFGDFNNNSTGTWADCIHFNTWGNGSGGRSNLLCLRKVGGFGMRIYQPTSATYQNTTNYTDYRDCVLQDEDGDADITNNLTVGGDLTIDSPVRTDLDMKMVCGSAISGITENKLYLKSGSDDGGATYLQYQDGTSAVEGVEIYVKDTASSQNRVAQFQEDLIVLEKNVYCSGDINVDDISVRGSINMNTIPLITQVHSFIQTDLNALNKQKWFSHSPHYDANTGNPVIGMKAVGNIVPYSLVIGTDNDAEALTNFTFEIRGRNNTDNIANLTTSTTVLKGTASMNSVRENDTKQVLISSPQTILNDTSWGLYLSNMIPDGYDGEIVVKVFFYQT